VCSLCHDGSFPKKPYTYAAILGIQGNPTCEDLYWMGLVGAITDQLCKPLQNYYDTPCGCSGGSATTSAAPKSEVVYGCSARSIPSAPVAAPAAAPVPAPVAAPVAAPVRVPVAAPIAAPVRAPVAAPVRAPVASPIRAPLATPVAAPVRSPIAAPVLPPIPAPVAAPIAPPVRAPAPVVAPARAPVAAAMPVALPTYVFPAYSRIPGNLLIPGSSAREADRTKGDDTKPDSGIGGRQRKQKQNRGSLRR
jgi:hypothetical protein